MNKFKCDSPLPGGAICGSTEFEIKAETHDTVMFGVDVDAEDGSFETTYSGKEYVGETDYAEEVTCLSCGTVYKLADIKEGRVGGIWAENNLFPRPDWQAEVAAGDTQRGYWDWVAAQKEQEDAYNEKVA